MKRKKLTAKLLSLFVMAAMLISMLAVNVGAAEVDPETGIDLTRTTGTVTLKENIGDKTATSEYSFYKVLDAATVEGSDVYEYTWNEAFKNFNKYTLDQIDDLINGEMDYHIGAAETVDPVADALEQFVTENKIAATYTAKANEPKEVEIGYYLVLETTPTDNYMVTKPMLIAVPRRDTDKDTYLYDVEITIKDQDLPKTEKKIEDEGQLKDSAEQQIGQPYTYVVWHPIPVSNPTWKKVVMTLVDKMDKGLTYVETEPVTVETYDAKDGNRIATLTNGTDFNLKVTQYDPVNGTTLTFDFSDHSKDETPGPNYYNSVKDAAWLKLTYTAKINENAEFGQNGVMNEVTPSFGPNGDITITGTPDKTKTFSGAIQITKKVEEGDLPKGTEFTVYTDEDCTEPALLGTYKVDSEGKVTLINKEAATAVVDESGIIRFGGLAAGTYYIKETDGPTGYIPLKNPIKVVVDVKLPETIETGNETATFTYTITGDENLVQVQETNEGIAYIDVVNTKGFTLPITGGNGIYLFIACGVIFFIAAAVMILKPKKKLDK